MHPNQIFHHIRVSSLFLFLIKLTWHGMGSVGMTWRRHPKSSPTESPREWENGNMSFTYIYYVSFKIITNVIFFFFYLGDR